MGTMLEHLFKMGRVLESRILVGLFSFLLLFALIQIVLRDVFSTGVVWGDTLSRHVLLWVSLLGTVRATYERKHIGIDLLPILPDGRLKRFCRSYSALFSLLTVGALFYASFVFVLDERLAGGKAFAGIPTWWLEIVFPVAFLLMGIRFAVHLLITLVGGKTSG